MLLRFAGSLGEAGEGGRCARCLVCRAAFTTRAATHKGNDQNASRADSCTRAPENYRYQDLTGSPSHRSLSWARTGDPEASSNPFPSRRVGEWTRPNRHPIPPPTCFLNFLPYLFSLNLHILEAPPSKSYAPHVRLWEHRKTTLPNILNNTATRNTDYVM